MAKESTYMHACSSQEVGFIWLKNIKKKNANWFFKEIFSWCTSILYIYIYADKILLMIDSSDALPPTSSKY